MADAKSSIPIISIESLWKPFALMVLDIGILAYVRQKAFADAAVHNMYADPLYVPAVMNILYLAMIYFGCRWMKTREPFEIKTYMFAYNFYQTVMNLCIVLGLLYEVHRTGMRFWGSRVDNSVNGLGLGFMIYAHYHNKYVEFLDTLFMVLRKKNNQISFLHVYHHTLLTWSWYAVVRWAPGGDAWFGSGYNSFIHVLMYSYYLFATFGIRCPWKKALTQMQMIQFCFCFTHAIYVGYLGSDCYPRALTALQAFVMVNMLVLFGNFYRKQYSKDSKGLPSAEESVASKEVPQPPPKSIAKPQPARPAGTPPASYYDALAMKGTGSDRVFTSEEVERHMLPSDGWMSINDGVYDVTEFIGKHPGGDVISLGLGRDCTILVESYHPAGRPDKVMEKYRIGTLHEWKTFYAWKESDFYPELKRRVVQKLKEAGAPRRGGLEIKGLSILALFFGSYALMVAYGSIFWAAVWGFAASHMGLSIQHDGNHGAFSQKGWLNRFAGWCMDVIGASSASWEFQHVIGHHQYTNLVSDKEFSRQENDPDVFSSYPLMRMHPDTAWRPHHQLQHWYAFPIFSFMTLAKVMQSDFQTFLSNHRGHINCSARLSTWQGQLLFCSAKTMALLMQIVIPCYFHGLWLGLGLFTVAHLVCGEYLAVCFIVNHISEACTFMNSKAAVEAESVPMVKQAQKEADAKRKHPVPPPNDWAVTQVLCCVNWRSGGTFANMFSGGLNHQIEHHLFPSIAHGNYPIIAPVVKDVCEEYGLPYKNYLTFWDAVVGMLEHLKTMGKKPSEAMPSVAITPVSPTSLSPGCSR